jgi:PhnB protein
MEGNTMSNVKPIPEGFHNVTPYLHVRGAAAAIDFYKKVFGATEIMRMPGSNGKIVHAEIRIGDSIVMLADENPPAGIMSPQTVGGYSVGLHVYVENVDAVIQKAVESGAKLLRPIKNQFYGDRSGTLLDPFGHVWSVATHVEDVSPEEMRKRMSAAMSQTAGS